MTPEVTEWSCTALDRATLEREIATFLRTHVDGAGLLLELLASIPPDRSEAEYRAIRAMALF